MTKFGHGVLTWLSTERRTQRYGTVYVGSETVNAKIASCTPMLDMAVLKPLVGKQVRIMARVLETRQSEHIGDLFLGVTPSTPSLGEVIEVGVGQLFLQEETFAPDGYAIGMKPSDGRDILWLDPRILYRLHEQTVDLFIEETDAPDSPKTDLEYGDTSNAISVGDGKHMQMVNMTGTVKIKNDVTSLGDGLYIMSPPDLSVRGKLLEVIP